MAEPQYPLFDAIGRAPQRRRTDRWLFLRLGAYLVQVAAIGVCIGMSSGPAVPDANRWLLLGACGLVAVGAGFVLIWPLARVIAEGLSESFERLRPSALRRLWIAPPAVPEVAPPHPRAPHLRLVWDRSKQDLRSGGSSPVQAPGEASGLPPTPTRRTGWNRGETSDPSR